MQTANKADEHLYFICSLSYLFSIQLKPFFHRGKKKNKKIKWQNIPHGRWIFFFPHAYTIPNIAYIIQGSICQRYFYWHQLVLYYILWDSLCAVINIPGYHSNQHLFNIYVESELKIQKKNTPKPPHLEKNSNLTARFLQDRWEYLTWHKEKADKNNLPIRLAHIKYVQGFGVFSHLITEPQIS